MKTWLYYRLSRDEDNEMNSLNNQRQILVDYAQQHGMKIVGESFDDNVSGMTFDRKGLKELEAAVDKGIVETVLVKDLSRLGRHRTQTALFIDHLHQNNVKVYSVTEGIDTSNENDDLLIGFKQIYNDFYAKDIGRKIRTGINQKQKKGLVINLPMGYYKDKLTDNVLIDEMAADIVREVFRLFLEGYGLSAIAREMNSRGVKSPEYYSHRRIGAQRTEMCKKFLWAQTTVKRLLTNEIYTGVLVNHKTVTNKINKTKTVIPEEERYRHEGFVPAIIDKQEFDKVKAVIDSRKQSPVRAKNGAIIHRYSGLIKCAECGAILIAKWRGKEGSRYVEYTCNSNHRYGKQYCTPHRIHEDQIDELVSYELLCLLDKLKAQSQKYDRIVKEWQKNKPKYEQRIQQYNDRIKLLREQVQDILMERINDKAHTEMYNEMISKREAEIKDLQKKVEEAKRFDEISSKKSTELRSTAEILEEIVSQPRISDSDLRMLVEKVYVHQNKDKSLDVRFVFNGAFEPSFTMNFEMPQQETARVKK